LGPFAGLKIPARGHWGGGDLVAKVFGLYESPLHPFWQEAIATRYPLFLDVGCADGFYATGFALRSPASYCIGFDQDQRAQASARQQVARNGLQNCEIRGLFDDESIPRIRHDRGLPDDTRVLLKCDIEGAERELFSEALCSELGRVDVLVELHDFQDDTTIENVLRKRFANTHRIEILVEAGRNPNAHRMLRNVPEDVRWLMVSESRWSAMRWLLARAVAG
jgi:SAM-dependent methyltransferase